MLQQPAGNQGVVRVGAAVAWINAMQERGGAVVCRRWSTESCTVASSPLGAAQRTSSAPVTALKGFTAESCPYGTASLAPEREGAR